MKGLALYSTMRNTVKRSLQSVVGLVKRNVTLLMAVGGFGMLVGGVAAFSLGAAAIVGGLLLIAAAIAAERAPSARSRPR